MNIENPLLFIEINETNYVFIAGKYDGNQNLKISEKIIVESEGFNKKKFINIDNASNAIKKNVKIIENKLNYVFKDVTVIIDNFDYKCINVSGYKKLNSSQLLKENVSYILNSLKSAIIENEQHSSILHIFNSNSFLDGTNVENLPIGLFGDFYNHELTFFLISNNDLKNINQIFDKSNLHVKKIILKNFCDGTQLIKETYTETFFKIKINKNTSNIFFFDKASLRYSENFDFGTEIIFKDIEKICSIEKETIINFLSDYCFKSKNFEETEFLNEKYFTKENYRKIRKKLIIDIAEARIEEIINIILNKNINMHSFDKENLNIYISIQDSLISSNFVDKFNFYLTKHASYDVIAAKDFKIDSFVTNVANLANYGWKKEAIPMTQTKNSIITRIFKSIFG